MTSTQEFRPDTCGCRFKQVWDRQTGQILEVTCLDACPAHQDIPHSEIWDYVFERPDSEQKRKNLLAKDLMERSALGAGDGENLRPGVKFRWSFSGTGRNRVLHYKVEGAFLSPLQKQTIEAMANSRGLAIEQ